jgi:predicted nicotinamide N-methyase
LYAGITAACLGAQVVATDLPATLPVLMANIHRNRALIAASGGSIEAVPLDWVCVGMGVRACAGNREPSMGSTGVPGAAAGEEEVVGGSSAPPHPTLAAAPVLLQQFDWVIGSDLVYSAEPVASLVNVFAALRAREGGVQALGVPRVLISHKHRHAAVDAALLSGLEDVGFRLVEVLRDDGSGVSVYVTPADGE